MFLVRKTFWIEYKISRLIICLKTSLECVKPESIKRLEQNLQHNIYVDYRKRDKLFEITSVAAVKEIVDKVRNSMNI